jgi:uncharacterized protein YndB with AHSA1/START domain
MSDDADDISLTIRRTIRASAARIFRAWTDPAELSRWFMPADTYTCVVAEADVRVGGRYRLVMRAPGGEEHRLSGRYQEIVPDRRLVFSWAWDSTPERESLVTVELHGRDDTTDLILTHRRFADAAARDRHDHGWTGCLAMLERHLAGQTAST